MNHRPITEDDLHAYVDRALEPERRTEVAAYLDEHPDVAKRVGAFTDQREALRAALAPIADEPLPAELNLSRMIEQHARRPSIARWAMAAVVLLSIGGVGGWTMRGGQPDTIGCERYLDCVRAVGGAGVQCRGVDAKHAAAPHLGRTP